MDKKQKFENLVNESPVFFLNPETEKTRYEREKNKLVSNLYQYKCACSAQYEGYGVELVKTCEQCLKSYRAENGLFTHYFDAAFKNEMRKTKAKESLEDVNGCIRLTGREKRILSAIANFLKKHPNVSADDLRCFPEKYADVLCLSQGDIEEGAKIYQTTPVVRGKGSSDSGDEEADLLDLAADTNTPEHQLMMNENVKEQINQIEEEYLRARGGSRKFLSLKLTSVLAQWDQNQEYYLFLQEKAFFDEKVYRLVADFGRELKNREICRIADKSEQNASQIWKKFADKLQILMKNSP